MHKMHLLTQLRTKPSGEIIPSKPKLDERCTDTWVGARRAICIRNLFTLPRIAN